MDSFTLQQTTSKIQILIVDDKPENLHLLSDALNSNEYEVKCVVNGEMALMVAASVIPDLILLDVVMPGLDGYQVCEKLKADEKTKDIPVIFLSFNNESVDRIKALNVGAVDYINKPFQINEVLLRIKNQLKLKAAQKEILKLNTKLEQRVYERTAQLEIANQELKFEIQQREQVARLLKDSEEKLESILNSLEEVVWSADLATSSLIFLNPAAKKVYGRSVDELLANPDLRLESIHPEDRSRVEASLTSSIIQSQGIEYRIVQPDGQIRWVWERSRLIQNQNGTIERRDGIICDITERKKVEEELSFEAKHDSLTNLPNRSAFTEEVKGIIRYCQQNSEYIFAVLFIDLDRFKIINDSLGHLIGDELLIYVAKVLTDCSRSGDFVARLGGDEFTILLGQIDSIEDAEAIAERIQVQLKTPFVLQGHTVFTSASIGIVLGDSHYKDSAEVLRDADIAMYRAKSDGKARHEIFDEKMYAETRELLEIENDLRNAILHKEFVLHYQPIISLQTDTLYGFEALLRWKHKHKGLIYPDQFIHVAEESGFIKSIGRWALEAACRQLRIWQVQYPNAANLKIGVNVTSQQLKDQNFLKILDQTLQQTGLSGKSLHLEITESTLMDYEPATVSLFNKIRHRGIQINIDDFGTGYSSLQYLNRFPINTLKIDRSFTNGMLQEKENFEIVKTIIALARTLKIEVIAEGVENIRQLQILKKLNCKFAQGYLFSSPVECNSAESLIDII